MLGFAKRCARRETILRPSYTHPFLSQVLVGTRFFSDCLGEEGEIGREGWALSLPLAAFSSAPRLPIGVKAPEGLGTVPGKIDLIEQAAVVLSQ